MPKYKVTVPVTAAAEFTIRAANPEAALMEAFEQHVTWDNITHLDTHGKVCEGNLCHAVINEPSLKKLAE